MKDDELRRSIEFVKYQKKADIINYNLRIKYDCYSKDSAIICRIIARRHFLSYNILCNMHQIMSCDKQICFQTSFHLETVKHNAMLRERDNCGSFQKHILSFYVGFRFIIKIKFCVIYSLSYYFLNIFYFTEFIYLLFAIKHNLNVCKIDRYFDLYISII